MNEMRSHMYNYVDNVAINVSQLTHRKNTCQYASPFK